jgi:hypothetical protein
VAAGAALGAGLARALRGKPEPTPELPPAPDPRADELREKLADARGAVPERDEAEAGETPVDEAEAPGEDIAERRRKVHAHGHAVAGEMRRRAAKKPKAEEE